MADARGDSSQFVTMHLSIAPNQFSTLTIGYTVV